ncbi:MAG: DEAD/DEAH box helicase [Minisyncoccia bacterium]
MYRNNGNFGRGSFSSPRFNGRGRGRGKFAQKSIDVSRYINTKVEVAKEIPFVPKHSFADFKIVEGLKGNIIKKGYVTPTPIQDGAIPEILAGRDIVGIANTGTGKTAAFLIPLIHKVYNGVNEQVLIIAPTRELAVQINDELKGFVGNVGIHSVCAVGGVPIGGQIRQLRFHNQFVIGTPGRIKDLMERGVLNISNYRSVVLDEADRMLDMGFINDMRLVMSKMPKERQTLFFSATLSNEIEKLISEFLNNPVRISVKTGDTAKNVHQDVVRVNDLPKVDVLHGLLSKDEFEKVLVFARTKHGVQKLSDELSKRGVSSTAIHGNKNQTQRQRALNDFKANKTKVLVATDVAARGLDIPNVSHVINFDVPGTHEDYIHRIGRTGRAGKLGKALTFI